MTSFHRCLPFFRSGAASSVPAEPQRSTNAGYVFSDRSPVEGARVLEENLFHVLGDRFSEASVKKLVSVIHSPIDRTRFSKSITNLPFTFRMKREKNGTLTLFIYGRISLGSGTYKKVKDAVEVTITPENECSVRDIVTQRIKKEIRPRMILSTISIFQKIEAHHSKNQSEERLKVGPSFSSHQYISKENKLRMELIQMRLEGDLSSVKVLTREEKLKILIDVADGLSQIHHAGYVHCDVKVENIFMEFKGIDNERKGYISDLDLIIADGSQPKSKNEIDYHAWDHLAVSGIYARNTDVYGLALSAVEAFLPKSDTKHVTKLGFFQQNKLIMKKELKKPSEEILLNLLKKENPSREVYTHFKTWIKKGKRKSKEEIRAKLNELFPIEINLINIFKREFEFSLKYYRAVLEQIKICRKENTKVDLKMILQESAATLKMSTIESLKNEFIEMLLSLEGRSPAASSVAVDPA